MVTNHRKPVFAGLLLFSFLALGAEFTPALSLTLEVFFTLLSLFKGAAGFFLSVSGFDSILGGAGVMTALESIVFGLSCALFDVSFFGLLPEVLFVSDWSAI